MMKAVLGLPLAQAKALLAGQECEVEFTRPPRRPDKTGAARVVRAACFAGTVRLTVSFFDDTAEEEEKHE